VAGAHGWLVSPGSRAGRQLLTLASEKLQLDVSGQVPDVGYRPRMSRLCQGAFPLSGSWGGTGAIRLPGRGPAKSRGRRLLSWGVESSLLTLDPEPPRSWRRPALRDRGPRLPEDGHGAGGRWFWALTSRCREVSPLRGG
jgi:hypothetical protein